MQREAGHMSSGPPQLPLPTEHPLAVGPLAYPSLWGRCDRLTFHPGDVGCRASCRQAEQGGCLSLQQHLVLEFDVEDWGKVWSKSKDGHGSAGTLAPSPLMEGRRHARASAACREQSERPSLLRQIGEGGVAFENFLWGEHHFPRHLLCVERPFPFTDY